MSRVTAQLTRDRMTAAREDAAALLLGWDAAVKAVGEAAGIGLGLALFRPPVGVVVKGTAAAAVLIDRLTGAGFRVEWRDRRDADDVPNHDLAVSWDGPDLGG